MIIQKVGENPTNFYERLCEAFRTDTPSDPETAENQRMINAAFAAQSCADNPMKAPKTGRLHWDECYTALGGSK